jgi:hypothetical protein
MPVAEPLLDGFEPEELLAVELPLEEQLVVPLLFDELPLDELVVPLPIEAPPPTVQVAGEKHCRSLVQLV